MTNNLLKVFDYLDAMIHRHISLLSMDDQIELLAMLSAHYAAIVDDYDIQVPDQTDCADEETVKIEDCTTPELLSLIIGLLKVVRDEVEITQVTDGAPDDNV